MILMIVIEVLKHCMNSFCGQSTRESYIICIQLRNDDNKSLTIMMNIMGNFRLNSAILSIAPAFLGFQHIWHRKYDE